MIDCNEVITDTLRHGHRRGHKDLVAWSLYFFKKCQLIILRPQLLIDGIKKQIDLILCDENK